VHLTDGGGFNGTVSAVKGEQTTLNMKNIFTALLEFLAF